MTFRLHTFLTGLMALLLAALLALGSAANPTSGGYQLFERAASSTLADIQLVSFGNFDTQFKTASECCIAPKRTGFDDLAQFRDQLGLATAGSAADRSTLAVAEANGQKIYGIMARAAAGDELAQRQLSVIAEEIRDTITDPLGAVREGYEAIEAQLAEAARLEAAGDWHGAAQIEAWIDMGATLVDLGGGAIIAIRGGRMVGDIVHLRGASGAAPNSAGGERLLCGSWDDYPKVTRTGPNGPQEYAQIGDRLYSQHAVARMQPSGQRYSSGAPVEGQPNLVGRDQTPPYVNLPGIQNFDGTQTVRGRSISPNYVEDIISNTTPTVSPTTGNRSYSSGDVLVVTSSEGRVITIVTGAD